MSCCLNNNINRYHGSGGGSVTMQKKYASKFSKVSSSSSNANIRTRNFSLNGINNNNIFNNIGNPNSAIMYTSCKTYDTFVKTSVKNTKAHINNKLFCSPLKSAMCYKKVNYALLEISGNLNKHFNSANRDQSSYINNLKGACNITISNEDFISSNMHECNSKKSCNITKDNNKINGITIGYDIYYNDSSLFRKKKMCNMHNPRDAKIIAC